MNLRPSPSSPGPSTPTKKSGNRRSYHTVTVIVTILLVTQGSTHTITTVTDSTRPVWSETRVSIVYVRPRSISQSPSHSSRFEPQITPHKNKVNTPDRTCCGTRDLTHETVSHNPLDSSRSTRTGVRETNTHVRGRYHPTPSRYGSDDRLTRPYLVFTDVTTGR